MEKKENQFEDAVFNRNLSAREISGLQYLGSYVIYNLTNHFEIQKNLSDEFQQSMALLSACIQNQKLVFALNCGPSSQIRRKYFL